MKIENITEGMVIKNYKELSKLLGVPNTGGNIKKKHLKELQRYVEYHKNGHKFIIDKVYDKPKPEIDGRGKNPNSHRNQNGAYGKYIRLLVLNMLSQSEANIVRIGTLRMLQELNMINRNYRLGNYNREEMAKYLGMDIKFIHEFYDTNTSKLQQTVERTLNKLMKNERLIFWSNIKMIGTDKGERQATDGEVKFILNCEQEVLKEMGINDIRHIYIANRNEEFYTRSNVKLKKQNIDYSYNAYKIIFSDEVYKKNEQLKYRLGIEDEMFHKEELNSTIYSNYNISAKNRHDKAKQEIEKILKELPDPEQWGTPDPEWKKKISDYKRIVAHKDFVGFNKRLNYLCLDDSCTIDMYNMFFKNKDLDRFD